VDVEDLLFDVFHQQVKGKLLLLFRGFLFRTWLSADVSCPALLLKLK
jgi:hypothetical protein